MKLYGTYTSPFVRRVRVVAAELGEPIELVNTATPEGTAELVRVAPIRKVPVAIVDGREAPLFDSRAIIDWMIERRGRGPLPARDRWDELDELNAIDDLLQGIIQLFYLRRENTPMDDTPYGRRQLDRAASIFAWLDARAPFGDGFGLAQISIVCALDWLEQRAKYPVASAGANVLAVRETWRDRPSLASTRIPT